MKYTKIIFLLAGLLAVVRVAKAAAESTLTRAQAEKILGAVSKGRLKLIGEKELSGQNAFVPGDFNSDGFADLAMVAAAAAAKPPRKTFMVIATQAPDGWRIAYSLPLQERPIPYVQSAGLDKSLEIGCVRCDKQAVTVFWDPKSKLYTQSGIDE